VGDTYAAQSAGADACVVDQDIRHSAVGHAEFGDRVTASGRGKIGCNRDNKAIAGIGSGALQRAVIEVGHYQLCACGAKLANHVPAKAAAGAGYQDCLASWIRHSGPRAF